jgi:hypothetical protein
VDVALEKIGFPRASKNTPQLYPQDSESEGSETEATRPTIGHSSTLAAGPDLEKVKFTHKRVSVGINIDPGNRGTKFLQEVLRKWEEKNPNADEFKRMEIWDVTFSPNNQDRAFLVMVSAATSL